ncbi:MAG: hypothetical protein LBR33_11500 [Propionibacteriaceae bacterium]|jgi:hypothetical protein|nr:hypothetical protein [Propionibacteriaceae bacterium]
MRTRSITVPSLLVLAVVSIVCAFARPAAAVADMDPPVLTNLRVEISDGPTAEPGETVTFTFDITDATGVGSVLFCVSGPESGDGHMLYAKRVEGTTWQVVWNVTDGDRPGVWRISYISYEDSSPLRNSKTDWPGESGPTVTVTYPEPVPPTSMEEIIQSIITMILNFIAQIVAAFGSLW